jgi:hypothetical protein
MRPFRRNDLRRGYLRAHVFELLIALLAAIAALGFFLDPNALERSPVGMTVHPWDQAWNALYFGGGVLIVDGLVRPSARLELAGLWLLASAVLAASVAVLYVRGAGGLASIAIYVAVVGACWVRGRDLVGGHP